MDPKVSTTPDNYSRCWLEITGENLVDVTSARNEHVRPLGALARSRYHKSTVTCHRNEGAWAYVPRVTDLRQLLIQMP